jgi:hypothetical protein
MYQFLKLISTEQLSVEVPSFLISLFVSEMLFKFGSFTFETLAFLLTWYMVSFVIHKITKK